MDESSLDLLRRVRSGDEGAAERLCQRYLSLLGRWASGRLPARARDLIDTDDLVQETLLATLRNLGSFEPRTEGALHAYLRQAVFNRIRNETKRARRRPAMGADPDAEADPSPSPLEQVIGRETLELYERALESLGEEDRAAIVARVEMGRSYREVARLLDK